MKFSRKLAAVSAAALLAGATGASAATLELADITAAWSNVVAPVAANANIQNGDPLNPWLAWGTPAGGGQNFDPVGTRSGYELSVYSDPVPNPASEVPGEFDFGEFTHFNNPISSGTSITSVDLTLTADVVLDGDYGNPIVDNAVFNFIFEHNETPNNCSPDPDCSDDTVTVTLLNDSSSVEVDGVLYTLNFLGFIQDGQLNDIFVSPEGGSSPGIIRAEFTSEVLNQVPLPAAGWLMVAGIGGLAALRRKKKAA